jgi:hypothetical protein
VKVAALVPDLMDRSRIEAVAPDTAFVTTPGELAESPADVYVVDLGRPGALDVLPALGGRVLAFIAHVDRATMEAARSSSPNVEVLTRSAFFPRVAELLQEG